MKIKSSSATKKIRKGDKVIALSGNYRGMTGTVLENQGERVIVQGLNVRKKHMKGSRSQPGSIQQIEKSIHISNVRTCDAEGNAVKLKVRENKKGTREFYYRNGDQEVLYRNIKKK